MWVIASMNFRQCSNLCGVFTIRFDHNQQRERRATGILLMTWNSFFGSNHCFAPACAYYLFPTCFVFFSCQCCLWFVFLSRLFSTPSRVVLVNCGWVSKEKCTFVWLFLYEWHAANKGWCDFVVFFYSVDVGHNKMSGTMTFWSCFIVYFCRIVFFFFFFK